MTAERRAERKLLADYEAGLDRLLAGLTPERLPLAVKIAARPRRDPRLRPRQGSGDGGGKGGRGEALGGVGRHTSLPLVGREGGEAARVWGVARPRADSAAISMAPQLPHPADARIVFPRQGRGDPVERRIAPP